MLPEEKPYAALMPIFYKNDVGLKGYRVLWRVFVSGDTEETREHAIELVSRIRKLIEKELDELQN